MIYLICSPPLRICFTRSVSPSLAPSRPSHSSHSSHAHGPSHFGILLTNATTSGFAGVAQGRTRARRAMASAGATLVAAGASSSALHHVCDASSPAKVHLNAAPSFGHVRCSSSHALSLSDSVKKAQVFGGRHCANDVVRRMQPIRAQAVDNEVSSKESSSSAISQKTTYYYLIANAKFMLDDEEHFQEQMQEKERMYGERNKEQDFWLVIEPEFLDKHPEVAAKVGRPAVALVSTDKVWISFMKLRLDRVLKGELTVDSPEEVLAGKLTTVKFERPAKWIAPYPKYEGDWWTSFLYKN